MFLKLVVRFCFVANMVLYNFKGIQTVPTAKEFIDVILNKVRRGTPSVVHAGFHIQRVRQFYMRKVKHLQTDIHNRTSRMLEQFPILDNIHPFYADLLNVLYDRDHFKLALGQVSASRSIVDNIGKDYVKLIKHATTPYQCKQLKRACFGKMCAVIKKLGSSLAYLEEVRRHMSRLPSIDPNERTLLICGYPNVGKSSFINSITRANVDVQNYAFTTKSLYVGHTDFNYSRWQIIDTPGILDHPLEERNTIEMVSITALAHLRAAILFLVDISEACGYTIEQQLDLFNSIRPLFANKPLVLVLNKIDTRPLSALSAEENKLLHDFQQQRGVTMVSMSALTKDGIMEVKQKACELLMQHRQPALLSSKKVQDNMNRLRVAQPRRRDNKARESFVPEGFVARKEDRMQQDPDLMEEEIEDLQKPEWMQGFHSTTVQKKKYILDNEDWKLDIVPEIMDGQNIADWNSEDILARLDELEREEDALLQEIDMNPDDDAMDDDLTDEQKAAVRVIREKKILNKQNHKFKQVLNHASLDRRGRPNNVDKFEDHLIELGLDPTRAVTRARAKSLERGRTRKRGIDDVDQDVMDVDKNKRVRSRSRSTTRDQSLKDETVKKYVEKLTKHGLKTFSKDGRRGESDRHHYTWRPKHLYTGKRGIGSNDRR